jgi:hypothetical protein
MSENERTFTLAEVARRLEVPPHRLIHLCEKQVVVPDIQDAGGRGSSRVFSLRNLLERAVALRLRDMLLPVTATGAIVHVIRALEDRLQEELPGFSLVTSLAGTDAPDLRVIISDGHLIFFSLGQGSPSSKLFGGISIDDLANEQGPLAGSIGVVDVESAKPGFGGPEASRFSRSEISLTAIAEALPLT